MGYTDGKITSTGVSIYDVQKALGTNECDLGSLCKHVNINMWARYKPETAVTGLTTYGLGAITLQQRSLNGYGIEARTNQGYGSISTLVTALRAGTAATPFTYKKPYGTSASPYRLTDFADYWHNAPAPIRAPYNPTDKLAVTQQGTAQPFFYVELTGSSHGLGLKDLRLQSDSNQLGEYYFGILLYNGSTYSAATQTNKMKNNTAGELIGVTLTGLPQVATTYQMIPFFSTQPFASASDTGAKTIYPMQFAGQEIETSLEAKYVLISTWVYVWSNDMSTLRMRYSVVNRISDAWTFTTQPYGTSSSPSYVEIGNSSQQGTYLRESINVSASCPAGVETTADVVIKSNLLSAQQDFIRNGDTRVHIEASNYNGMFTYDDIVQIWTP